MKNMGKQEQIIFKLRNESGVHCIFCNRTTVSVVSNFYEVLPNKVIVCTSCKQQLEGILKTKSVENTEENKMLEESCMLSRLQDKLNFEINEFTKLVFSQRSIPQNIKEISDEKTLEHLQFEDPPLINAIHDAIELFKNYNFERIDLFTVYDPEVPSLSYCLELKFYYRDYELIYERWDELSLILTDCLEKNNVSEGSRGRIYVSIE